MFIEMRKLHRIDFVEVSETDSGMRGIDATASISAVIGHNVVV